MPVTIVNESLMKLSQHNACIIVIYSCINIMLAKVLSASGQSQIRELQDCFLQKEARVCVSNAFVLEDSMFK